MNTLHLDEIAALDRECYPQNPLSAAVWQRVMQDGEIHVGYCSEPGRAFYVIRKGVEGGQGVVKLLRLGVAPADRGKGLGRVLLGALEGVNCECVLRENNRAGLELLKSTGFATLGLDRGRFGELDGVVMWRKGTPEEALG